MPLIDTGVAELEYLEDGDPAGFPVVLVHGFPDIPATWEQVVPRLPPGLRIVRPYLRGYGGIPAGWYPTCGTSEATPLFSGIVALSDQVAGHSLGLINPALYQLSAEHAPGIVDVTSGNNTVSFTQDGKLDTVKGFSALKGYDLATGVGTVNGAYFVPELARAAGR